MHVYILNKPLFELPQEHPARQFLEAFIECRKRCVGREAEGIDQEWWSDTDNRMRHFSSFAYEHLAFDVVLDGWLSNSRSITDSERAALKGIPYSEALMQECRKAALADANVAVVELIDLVLNMLTLWKQCIYIRL